MDRTAGIDAQVPVAELRAVSQFFEFSPERSEEERPPFAFIRSDSRAVAQAEEALSFYLDGERRRVLVSLLTERLEPGYELSVVRVSRTASIEVILLVTAAYRLVRDGNDVIETVENTARNLREFLRVHGLVAARYGIRSDRRHLVAHDQ